MEDHLIRTISDEANVRGIACTTTNLVNESCMLHGTSPTASVALGKALTAGLLMGALLKNDQRLGLKFEGNGPLGKIIVEADSTGTVRGFVGSPEADAPPMDGMLKVSELLGTEGYLTVIRDEGRETPYQGIVKLRTGEIGEDIAHYFTESEQIPSAVGLGVFVQPDGKITAAGGFLIQSLPHSDEDAIDSLIENLGCLPPVSAIIGSGSSPKDMLNMIFGNLSYRTLASYDIASRCTCSRKRIEKVLASLGQMEIKRLIEEEGEAVVTCEFCKHSYHFNRDELKELYRTL